MSIRFSVVVILGGAMGNLIDRVFYGYIFSNKKGSYQFFTKTEASLFDEIKDDLDLIKRLYLDDKLK